MGDAVFPADTLLGTFSDTAADFYLMDELLLGGNWLENTNGSDFLRSGQSASSALFESSYFLHALEIDNGHANLIAPLNDQEETKRLVFPAIQSLAESQVENLVGTKSLNQNAIEISGSSGQSKCYPAEGSYELSRRWWNGQRSNRGPISSVRERLMQAIGFIRETIKERDILIQIWVPIKRGGKHVLTTDGQLFSLDPNCQRLANYRSVSMNYQFSVGEDSNELVGLPARVFLGKVPEWTPDVRLYHSDEFLRIDYAQRYDVRGTLALPIFERDSRTCLGVVEVVMTTQKINYRPELEHVCKALEAVDLRCSEVSISPYLKACNESYQAALPEILEVLRAVCETHKLPIAQTWVPCIQQGKGGCQHSDENYANCVSTVDSACYVTDPHVRDFHEACSEHHLFRGQGIAGKAFMTNQPCFSTDVTAFSKAEYPLLHYARMFGLRAAVAVRLRSAYTRTTDYILEFFLPVDCQDTKEQKMILNSMAIIMQGVFQSLRFLTDKELEDKAILQFGKVVLSNEKPNTEEGPKLGSTSAKESPQKESSWIFNFVDAHLKGKSVPLAFQKEEPNEEFKFTSHYDNPGLVLQGKMFSESLQHHQDSGPKGSSEYAGDSFFGECSFSKGGKTGEKRRTKTEKTISLQVLRQYFAGSLKDAAKNIGVCPTTLKRICRQHGITRWPSRKIKKVGHSLRKLQVVIDSVQGAEGAFQIGSFHANFPDLTSPNVSGTNLFSTSKSSDNPKPLNTQPESIFKPQAAASKSSTSSRSQSSCSSLCCSVGTQHQPHTAHITGSEDASMMENPDGLLRRAYGDAELDALSQKEPRLPAKSQSHKSLNEHPSRESLPPLPKGGSHVSQEGSAFRVKVMYGDEKIRFSMQPGWGFNELQQEIARRFNIFDMNRFDLKYLDDDSEWVLLACDTDLEECTDIYKSSQTRTIKLSVNQGSHLYLGRSVCSSGPS